MTKHVLGFVFLLAIIGVWIYEYRETHEPKQAESFVGPSDGELDRFVTGDTICHEMAAENPKAIGYRYNGSECYLRYSKPSLWAGVDCATLGVSDPFASDEVQSAMLRSQKLCAEGAYEVLEDRF